MRLADGRIIRFPAVMGILNVTPDSFSDGGLYIDPDRAVAHALEMEAAAAAIIDIGGESTRPVGAAEVSVETELARVMPVIERLAGRLRAPISVDTRRAAVARAALDAGAAIINDISALEHDPEMARVVAQARAAVILMHMRGGPTDHARHARYRDVLGEVAAYLGRRSRFALEAGVPRSRIILDPGLGFAKNARHNLILMGGLWRLCALGFPVAVGASRKRFVRALAGEGAEIVEIGNAAAHALAVASGAAVLRAHRVDAAMAALRMAAAIAAERRS
jgi:dihydropteroate synthase